MSWLPRRWPLVPTLLVLAAAAAMVGLGFWQVQRAGQKEAFIALVRANPARPAVSYPELGPVPPELMFRRSSLHCLSVDGWQAEAGRATDGSTGFRYIAHCLTGAEGPGALVATGIGGRPDLKPDWKGGDVSGWIAEEPDHRSLLAHLTGPKVVLRPMLIAQVPPVEGLKASAPPRTEDIPNNHRSYAVQWFCFAAIALIIYVLALRRRELKND
ncbi:MAG: SURF1 family cytochrome oxidase biogenesis protein [Sphingobium sp.]